MTAIPPAQWDALALAEKADELNQNAGFPLFANNNIYGVKTYDPAPTGLIAPANTVSIAVDSLRWALYVPRASAVCRSIDFSIQGAGTAGSKFRVGLWDLDLVGGFASLLRDFGEEDGTVIGIRSYAFPFSFVRGHPYGLSYLCGTAAPTIQAVNAAAQCAGAAFSYSGEGWCGFQTAFPYAALPSRIALSTPRAAQHVLPVVMVGY